MSFHEVRFPDRLRYGAAGGPMFNTTILEMDSGHEQRNINWSVARRKYEVSVPSTKSAKFKDILDFFMARRGRAYGFRFKDWGDFKLQNQPIGIGDGTAATFQIIKTYEDAAGSYVQAIRKPVSGTITVSVNGSPVAGGFSVDTTTGILSFTVAPAAGEILVTGEFDIPVRFDTDRLQAVRAGPDIDSWESVRLVEVRV